MCTPPRGTAHVRSFVQQQTHAGDSRRGLILRRQLTIVDRVVCRQARLRTPAHRLLKTCNLGLQSWAERLFPRSGVRLYTTGTLRSYVNEQTTVLNNRTWQERRPRARGGGHPEYRPMRDSGGRVFMTSGWASKYVRTVVSRSTRKVSSRKESRATGPALVTARTQCRR